MKILYFFLFLCVIFALLDPDPDPATQINADPCGSGSETLHTIPGKRNYRFPENLHIIPGPSALTADPDSVRNEDPLSSGSATLI
jgi:hypothetical protein